MAVGPGRNAYFSVNINNLSTYLSDASLTRAAGTAETTSYGDSWREFVTTLKESGVDVTGNWDSTIDALMAADFGTSRTFEYGPAGSTAGYVKLSGSAILTSYDITPALDGRLEFSGTYTVTGAVAVGTFP